jgi:hypothetical protein
MIVRARTQLGHSAPVESLTPSTLQTEGFLVTRNNSLWILLTSMAIAAPLAACGSSSGGTGSTSTPSASAPLATAAATPTVTTAAAQCPTGASVGSALGTTLPDAVGVGGGSSQLPGGATAIICDYHASTENVIIEILSNISPSYIGNFSSHYPVPYKSVPGVGDQARSFLQMLNNGKDNEGVVASKGQTMVSIGATATPATLSQVEALVSSLL